MNTIVFGTGTGGTLAGSIALTMDSSNWLDTITLEWFIPHMKGSQIIISKLQTT